VQQVPEEVFAAITAAAGDGGAPYLSIEPATTAACTLHFLQPCRQKVSKSANILEKEAANHWHAWFHI